MGSNLRAQIGLDHIHKNPIYGGDNAFTIDQEFAAHRLDGIRDYTCFSFTYMGNNEFLWSGSCLDEGVSLYLVNEGAHFRDETIENGSFWEIPYAGGSVSAFDLGAPGLESYLFSVPYRAFIGIRTPKLGMEGSTYSPAYGWMYVINQDGVLQLENHAVDYSGCGMYVGHTTPVPEVGTGGGVMICLLILLACREWKRISRGQKTLARVLG